MTASLLYSSKCFLGESPMWHPERKSCFWVDIDNHVLYELRWQSRSVQTWTFENKVTLVVRGRGDDLILAFQGGIGRFNPDTGSLEWLLDLDREINDMRCNDGRCDSQGRLWVGTLQMQFREGAGSLYMIEKDLTPVKKIEKATISNGVVWSQDNRRMYFIDSPTQRVESYVYEEGSGKITPEKTAIHVPRELGTPDGMCMDEEGMLWIGLYHGSAVCRWNPATGQLLEKITLPVPNVTSCAFAGEALDHLIITTARENLGKEELEIYPESGSVFFQKMQVKGIPSKRCSL